MAFLFSLGFSFLRERLDPVGLSPVRTAHPQERAEGGAAARPAVPGGSGTGPAGAEGKGDAVVSDRK